MKCPCGKDINSTANTCYSFVRFDSQGNIVYAVCVHGVVIVNKEITESEELEKPQISQINTR